MDAQQFEELEAKIRDTTMLVTRLREDKRRLQQENARLRERVAELEEELQEAYAEELPQGSDLERLLRQLDALQQDDDDDAAVLSSGAHTAASQTPEVADSVVPEDNDPLRVGAFYEQQGQFAEAVNVYQHILDNDAENVEAMQRLATLLEKLNRNAEASRLWQKIWQMHQAKPTTKRRWLR